MVPAPMLLRAVVALFAPRPPRASGRMPDVIWLASWMCAVGGNVAGFPGKDAQEYSDFAK